MPPPPYTTRPASDLNATCGSGSLPSESGCTSTSSPVANSLRSLDRRRLIPRANAHDVLPFLQEQARRGQRLIDDSATILAHVEHDALCTNPHERVHSRPHFFRRVFIERLERDVADVIARAP